MKTKMIIALITLAGGFSHACIGGHQSKLVSQQGTEVATLDKNEQTITLAEGAQLKSMGNCDVDNPELDLTLKQYDVNGYIDSNHDLCFGIQLKDQKANFRVTADEMNTRSRSLINCGREIKSQD